MVASVLTIGAGLTILMILIGYLLLKASANVPYLAYIPGAVIFVSGIVLIVIAAIAGKIEILGAGLGGWGIAFLFSAGIGFIITSIIESYARAATN